MEKDNEHYALNNTLTPAEEIAWLRSYVKELKGQIGECTKPLLFKIGVLESEKAELIDKEVKLRNEVTTQETLSKLQKKLSEIKRLEKSDRKKLMKDEIVLQLNMKIAEKNKLIERLRKDNSDLICQLVQARNISTSPDPE